MAYTDDEKKSAELSKLVHDYYKHLTTVGTGSILLLVTFIDKLVLNPHNKTLISTSIVCFLVCVVSSVIVQTYAVETMHKQLQSTFVRAIVGIVSIAAWLGFLLGVAALAGFALLNFGT